MKVYEVQTISKKSNKSNIVTVTADSIIKACSFINDNEYHILSIDLVSIDLITPNNDIKTVRAGIIKLTHLITELGYKMI